MTVIAPNAGDVVVEIIADDEDHIGTGGGERRAGGHGEYEGGEAARESHDWAFRICTVLRWG